MPIGIHKRTTGLRLPTSRAAHPNKDYNFYFGTAKVEDFF